MRRAWCDAAMGSASEPPRPRCAGRVAALLTAGCVLGGALLAGALLDGCALGSTSLGACGGTNVRITVGQFGVGHGHFGGALLFRNRGTTACTLRGYPVAWAVANDGGREVALRDTDRGYVGGLLPGTTRAPGVVLAPGAVASAIVEGVSAASPSAPCPAYRALLVGVPGGRATTSLAVEATACRRLQIHPIVPGESGNQSP